MNFEAVIKATLNKGDVESQLNELLKPRQIDITPNFDGGSGNLSSGSKRSLQRQARASAKTYNAEWDKNLKNVSGVYSTKRYTVSKKAVRDNLKEISKQNELVNTVVEDNNNVDIKQARKAVNQAISEQKRNIRKQEQEAERLSKANERKAKRDVETAAKNSASISNNVDNKSYRANYEYQKSRLGSYYNGSEEYKNADKALKQYEADLTELENRQKSFKADSSTSNQQALIQQNEKVSQSFKTLTNEMKILSATQDKALNPGQGTAQANKIRTYLEENSKAAKKYGQDLQDLINQAEKLNTTGELKNNQQQFNNLKSKISAEGLSGNSYFDEIKRGFKQIGQFASTYGILQGGMSKAQEMVQNTYDVDDAMTQLQMATGVSNDKAKDLMKTYSDMGHQLKATGTDVAASSTEWMKQGQSVEQSNKLAESSIKLSKVGELSSEDATKYLTSARKGYGITSAEDTLKIVDKMSSVDMASATDVGGLAEGMSEVATNANLAGKIDARPYGDIWAIFINSSYYPNRLKPDWAIVA